MLTQTSITAIRTLIHVGSQPKGESLSIRRVAEQLGESPSYLAKVARHLVKAGLLKARYGKAGGIVLNRPAGSITLLAIVEACQGAILPDFCRETPSLDGVCAFHVAATELHNAIVGTLSGWTLSRLLERPGPVGRRQASIPCLLRGDTLKSASPLEPGFRSRSKKRRVAAQIC